MRSTLRFLVAASLMLVPAAARAQLGELQPGTRIRVVAPGAVAGRLDGIVVARTGDTVTVTRRDAAPLPIPIAAITGLEVSRGESRTLGAKRGALWGGGIGLGLGLLTAATVDGCGDEGDCDDYSDGEYVLWNTLSAAIAGAAIGAIVGADRWERVTLPPRVTVAPVRGSVRVAVTIPWGAGRR